MKAQLTIASYLLFSSLNSYALELSKEPFVLDCMGAQGTAHFEQTPQGIHYDIQTKADHVQGFVASYKEDGNKWEEGSAYLLTPVTSEKNKWLSVSVIHGTKVWNPAHEGCLFTRANICVNRTIPGSYSNIPDEWLEIMVDLSVNGKVSLVSLNLGKKNNVSLGEAKCSLKGP